MKFHKNRCYNGGPLHNFEPRYNQSGVAFELKGASPSAVNDILDKARNKIYICDVCVWCGKKIDAK